MAGLIYMAISSLDGYIEDASGAFDWAAPDDEMHGFVNGRGRRHLQRPPGSGASGRAAVWQRHGFPPLQNKTG